jgi:hypothetical protein
MPTQLSHGFAFTLPDKEAAYFLADSFFASVRPVEKKKNSPPPPLFTVLLHDKPTLMLTYRLCRRKACCICLMKTPSNSD